MESRVNGPFGVPIRVPYSSLFLLLIESVNKRREVLAARGVPAHSNLLLLKTSVEVLFGVAILDFKSHKIDEMSWNVIYF